MVDRSHWGRLRITGEDRLNFLHGQSTADMKGSRQGTGCQTVRCRCCSTHVGLLQLRDILKCILPSLCIHFGQVNCILCSRLTGCIAYDVSGLRQQDW